MLCTSNLNWIGELQKIFFTSEIHKCDCKSEAKGSNYICVYAVIQMMVIYQRICLFRCLYVARDCFKGYVSEIVLLFLCNWSENGFSFWNTLLVISDTILQWLTVNENCRKSIRYVIAYVCYSCCGTNQLELMPLAA